jgi:NADH:ubiquinone oxidoreductase subunit 3 (subunit A)
MTTLTYIYLAYYIVSVFFVTLLLVAITFVLSKKQYYSEKVSAYECGFEPFHGIRRPVNINFYNIALLFLLFDVEVVLLLPGISCFAHMFQGQLWLYLFVILLWIGYVYELQSDSLYIIR